jgi:hypothetical protein
MPLRVLDGITRRTHGLYARPAVSGLALLLAGLLSLDAQQRARLWSVAPTSPSSRIGPFLLIAAVVLAAVAGLTFGLQETGWAWLALALAAALAVLGAALVTRGRASS